MDAKRRFEVATSGIDEGLQGLSSDPYASSFPSFTGLRIPDFVNTPTTRYLFCLATYTARAPTKLLGLRQLLTIGFPNQNGKTPAAGFDVPVDDSVFRFPDGNVSWHLVREPNARRVVQRPLTDAPSWAFTESDQPAMLYQRATWSAGNFNPVTGAPNFYNVGMTSYAPPLIPPDWKGIAGLGNFNDLRFPWDSHNAWNSLGWAGVEIETGERVSVYATVLQTDPAHRLPFVALFGTLVGVPAPIAFVTTAEQQTTPLPVVYWRIGAALLFEEDAQQPMDVHDGSGP